MTAIIGGLGAAVLWAVATLCSSRSSRMLGSRVVLAWVMVVGVVIALPIAIVSPAPATLAPSTLVLLGIAGICYVIGLQCTYAGLRIGKVSIVAPIVATEGAVAAVIAIALGDSVGVVAGLMLAAIAVGVVLSTLEPGRTDVPAGDFDVVIDAIDDAPPVQARPPVDPTVPTATGERPIDTRRATLFAIGAALFFGIGLVAAGRAASLVPVAWVALSARLVGVLVVVIPLVAQGRLRLTRRGAAARRPRRRGRGHRLDAVGVGLPREHPDHGRDGQPVRGDRRRRRVPVVRRTPRAAPGRGRRPHRHRRHAPGRCDGVSRSAPDTGYTAAP